MGQAELAHASLSDHGQAWLSPCRPSIPQDWQPPGTLQAILSKAPQNKETIDPGRHSRMFLAGIQQKSREARRRGHGSWLSDTHLRGAVLSHARAPGGRVQRELPSQSHGPVKHGPQPHSRLLFQQACATGRSNRRGVAQTGQRTCLGSRGSEVQILSPRPLYGPLKFPVAGAGGGVRKRRGIRLSFLRSCYPTFHRFRTSPREPPLHRSSACSDHFSNAVRIQERCKKPNMGKLCGLLYQCCSARRIDNLLA